VRASGGGGVWRVAASSVTSLVYGAPTVSHLLGPRQFWPLRLYAAEPRYVRLNLTVSALPRAGGGGGGGGGGGVVGVYARRGAYPSHTRYDVFHAVDVDRLSAAMSTSEPPSRPPRPPRSRRSHDDAAAAVAANVSVCTFSSVLSRPRSDGWPHHGRKK